MYLLGQEVCQDSEGYWKATKGDFRVEIFQNPEPLRTVNANLKRSDDRFYHLWIYQNDALKIKDWRVSQEEIVGLAGYGVEKLEKNL